VVSAAAKPSVSTLYCGLSGLKVLYSVASGVMMLARRYKQRTQNYLKKQVDAVGHQVTTYQCQLNTIIMKIINKKTGKNATGIAIKLIEQSLIKSGYTIAKPHKLSTEDAQEFDDFMDNLAINNGTTLY